MCAGIFFYVDGPFSEMFMGPHVWIERLQLKIHQALPMG